MAVFYKFKSLKDYESIAMDGPFISVGTLKNQIFELKHLGNGKDFDVVVTNAQTNEVYLDEAALIPKNTSVLVQRVPGPPSMPIVIGQRSNMINKVENVQPSNTYSSVTNLSAVEKLEEDWDDFGDDIYSPPKEPAAQSSNPLPVAISQKDIADEDSKIQALIATPALDWQRQGVNGFGPGRGYIRGTGGRGSGRLGIEQTSPPAGYVCHRCNVPGHFIQHCPTNGDPNYDIKRVNPPTGIPKSMLMANPDGSYALPNGTIAVLKPNEDAFDKEMEGLSSARSVMAKTESLEAMSAPKAQAETIQAAKPVDVSEAINGPMHVKEAAPQGASRVLEKGHQQMISGEQGTKTNNKKAQLHGNNMQWNPVSDLAAQNYMMHMASAAFYQYWNAVQPGLNGCSGPYPGHMPPMSYGLYPVDTYGGVMPQLAQGSFGYPGMTPPPHSGDTSLKNHEKRKEAKCSKEGSPMKTRTPSVEPPLSSRDRNGDQHQTQLRRKTNSHHRERDYDYSKRTRDEGRGSDKEAAARKRRKVSSHSSTITTTRRTESGGHRDGR